MASNRSFVKESLTIVADENIPFISDIFSDLGKLVLIPGQFIDHQAVKQADILLVRTITKVNEQLLSSSSVRYVGSATAGLDHVDVSFLSKAGVYLAHAPGANAVSVVEYVLACLAQFAMETDSSFANKSIGIVGVGHVGGLLAERCEALGMNVLLNDPPRKLKEANNQFVDLQTLLEESDIVSIHTPLSEQGPFTTNNLIDKNAIIRLRTGSWFVHTARGGVCDESELVAARRRGQIQKLALDVWENEPTPSPDSVAAADIATGHIAGYSIDAKIRGLLMLRTSLMAFLGMDEMEPPPIRVSDKWISPEQAGFRASFSPAPHGSPKSFSPAPHGSPESTLPTLNGLPESFSLEKAILQMYPIPEDDRRFRTIFESGPAIAERFHDYRAKYPVRRTFSAFELIGTLPANWKKGLV